MVVIGGGYIGLELGSVWPSARRRGDGGGVPRPAGARAWTAEIGKTFERVLGKQGVKFQLKTKVTGAEKTETGVKPHVGACRWRRGGNAGNADVVLVAIGRRPYYQGLGLEAAGVERWTTASASMMDAHYATNVPGIYAIGDVIDRAPCWRTRRKRRALALAEIGWPDRPGHVNYGCDPRRGLYLAGSRLHRCHGGNAEGGGPRLQCRASSPFTANGRARAMGATDGFVKILADKTTDEILGAHIIGPDAGTLIAEIATAMEFGASSEDVARTCHAHPSLNEAVKGGGARSGRPRAAYLSALQKRHRRASHSSGLKKRLETVKSAALAFSRVREEGAMKQMLGVGYLGRTEANQVGIRPGPNVVYLRLTRAFEGERQVTTMFSEMTPGQAQQLVRELQRCIGTALGFAGEEYAEAGRSPA